MSSLRVFRLRPAVVLMGGLWLVGLEGAQAGIEYSLTSLGDLPGGTVSSTGNAINEAGQVAGYSAVSGGMSAFLWSGGIMSNLGSAGFQSWSMGLNDSGRVVGLFTTTPGAYHAFSWDLAAGWRDLGDLPGGLDYSKAAAINNPGQIVGY
ncbi:MAG TPA: hypothetical protein PK437_08285, partial [Thiobacillaceae bacterium]|nr:hypothetical protein [Thiobacillaceae bacterium]